MDSSWLTNEEIQAYRERQVAWSGFFKQVVSPTEFPIIFPVMTLKLSKKLKKKARFFLIKVLGNENFILTFLLISEHAEKTTARTEKA